MHTLIKELVLRRVERRPEIHFNESRRLVKKRTEVARLRRRLSFFFYKILIPNATSSGSGACEHPTAPFVMVGACARALHRGNN